MSKVLILLGFILSFSVSSSTKKGLFSGRVTKINLEAKFLRVKIDFLNMKYLNKGDRVSFYQVEHPGRQCQGYLMGKTSEFYLFRVPEIKRCNLALRMTPGAYLHFYSDDLIKNIKVGEELTRILLKKHTVLQGKIQRVQNEIDGNFEKKEIINSRYEVLREKLEKEWADELGLIEEDRLEALRRYENAKLELDELKAKLEKYRVNDENLKTDRWALDNKLYYKR